MPNNAVCTVTSESVARLLIDEGHDYDYFSIQQSKLDE